ncbi:MAG: hypothetical protein KDB01_24530 [Planctomycetaceae bacterium]|nr:hypothetical protein [Planctomycetaceae bacterium]
MGSTASYPKSRTYHPNAFKFVYSALRFTQERLGRDRQSEVTGHISGPELLDGLRVLALQHFGMLSAVVFRKWGVKSTDDFGHIVFEMIELGEMRRTPHDQLSDFFDVYDFDKVFQDDYVPETSSAFSK